jgi:inner membrane protein
MNELVAEFFGRHDYILYAIAGALLIVELSILGVSGILLFVAVACVLTGGLVSFGVISGWDVELLFVAIFTALTVFLFWRPLKAFQNSGGGADTSSDMIGREVPVSQDILQNSGKIRYSGINWNARLDSDAGVEVIAEGQRAVIAGVDGNVMLVKPL